LTWLKCLIFVIVEFLLQAEVQRRYLTHSDSIMSDGVKPRQEHKIIWGELNPAAVDVQIPSWLKKGRTSTEYIFDENIAEIAAREKVTRAAVKQDGTAYVQYHDSARKESGGRRVDRKLTGFVRKSDMKMMGFEGESDTATHEPTSTSRATSSVTVTTATTVHSKKSNQLQAVGEPKKPRFTNDQLGADSDDEQVKERRARFRSEHRKQTGNVDKSALKAMFQDGLDDDVGSGLPAVHDAAPKPEKADFKPVPPSAPRESPPRPKPRFVSGDSNDRSNLNVNFDANCRSEEDQAAEPENEAEKIRVKRIRERRGTGKVDKAAAAAFTGKSGENSTFEDQDNEDEDEAKRKSREKTSSGCINPAILAKLCDDTKASGSVSMPIQSMTVNVIKDNADDSFGKRGSLGSLRSLTSETNRRKHASMMSFFSEDEDGDEDNEQDLAGLEGEFTNHS
jgi:hypothetical protein